MDDQILSESTTPLPQAPQPPTAEVQLTKNIKLIWVAGGVLALLIVVFGIYFFMQGNRQSTTTLPTAQTTPQPTMVLQPTVQVDETTGWEKIINKNGFSFMYPDSVDIIAGAAVEEKPEISTIITIKEKGTAFDGPQMRIGLWDSINEKSESLSYPSSFSEFAKVWYETNVENPNSPVTIIEDLHETTIQGRAGYEFTFNCKGFNAAPIGSIGPAGVCRIVFINDGGIFYSIGFYKNTVFDKIFETLKFE